MNKTAVINGGIAQDRWASIELQPSHAQPTCERWMDGWEEGVVGEEERQQERQGVDDGRRWAGGRRWKTSDSRVKI